MSPSCSAGCADLHPADLGFVLEGLEPDDRLQIWTALEPGQAAEAIVEIDASVRAWLIGETPNHRLVKIAEALDPDDLAWISDDLPDDVMRQVRESLGEIDRTLLQQADAYPPQSVGRLMSLDVVDRARDADDGRRAARSSGALGAARPSRSAVCRRRPESAARRVEPAVARRRESRDDSGCCHGTRSARVSANRDGGKGGPRVRALRSRVAAGRERSRQTRGAPHGRCGRRFHPSDGRQRRPRHGGPSRRRGYVRAGRGSRRAIGRCGCSST